MCKYACSARAVVRTQCTVHWGGIFTPFMQMHLTGAPLPHVATLYSVLCSYRTQMTDCYWLLPIGPKKASSHLLFITRDARNSVREMSTGQTHLFNIWTGRKQIKVWSSYKGPKIPCIWLCLSQLMEVGECGMGCLGGRATGYVCETVQYIKKWMYYTVQKPSKP